MTGFPNSPRLIKGGIVTMDPDTTAVQNVIALQYNPDSLTRSLQIQALPGGPDGVRVDALRLRGPAVETIKLEAELDATDQLEAQNQTTVVLGLQPQLSQLEMLINPTIETLQADDAMANAGTLEIIPLEQPLTLFVWSKSRVVPVRLTDFSVTEEAFDANLNPIRAKVSLGLRVLSVDDLGFAHPGGRLFMAYLGNKEQLASQVARAPISVLGLADDVGYVFYLDPGPEPGMSKAYWGPQIKVGPIQPALNSDMDAYTNVESLHFNFDQQQNKIPTVFIYNEETGVSIPIPIPPVTPLNPPLGAIPPLPTNILGDLQPIRSDLSKRSIPQAIMIGLAASSQWFEAVTGEGSLDVTRYGGVLKARQLVGVRGAGPAFDGLYYVKSVTHKIKRGEYKQDFKLSRNGLVSTVPTVSP